MPPRTRLVVLTCPDCGDVVEYERCGAGRPRERCPDCAKAHAVRKQSGYHRRWYLSHCGDPAWRAERNARQLANKRRREARP
jgi:hypothetical protein